MSQTSLDALPDVAAFLVVVLVAEPLPPVAEVGGDHEDVGRVGEVACKDPAILDLQMKVILIVCTLSIQNYVNPGTRISDNFSTRRSFCPILDLLFVAERPHEDRDDSELAFPWLHDPRDVGQVHLDGVLVLVLIHIHHL